MQSVVSLFLDFETNHLRMQIVQILVVIQVVRVLFLLQGEVEHLHHVLHIVEVQAIDVVFLYILDVVLVINGKDEVGHAVALGSKDFLLHTAHWQHTTTQRNFTRHG